MDLAVRAKRLQELHHGPRLLVLPNAGDVASARIFELEGFDAVGTTSAGIAWSLGHADGGRITLDEVFVGARTHRPPY